MAAATAARSAMIPRVKAASKVDAPFDPAIEVFGTARADHVVEAFDTVSHLSQAWQFRLDQRDQHEVGARQAFRGEHQQSGDCPRTRASAWQFRCLIPAPAGRPLGHDPQRASLTLGAKASPEFRTAPAFAFPIIGQPVEMSVQSAGSRPEDLRLVATCDGADALGCISRRC